jgi:hypothetical protein
MVRPPRSEARSKKLLWINRSLVCCYFHAANLIVLQNLAVCSAHIAVLIPGKLHIVATTVNLGSGFWAEINIEAAKK